MNNPSRTPRANRSNEAPSVIRRGLSIVQCAGYLGMAGVALAAVNLSEIVSSPSNRTWADVTPTFIGLTLIGVGAARAIRGVMMLENAARAVQTQAPNVQVYPPQPRPQPPARG